MVLAIGETFAQEHAPLPGGASSLQETYADWIVSCVHGAALAELRTGAVLKMMAKANNTNEPISLSASLKGFSAVLDRVTALMK
ncbi:hypothetical protein BKP54_31560 [Ensifer sp. 1H6]|nr:hypothetical protein BKP54_31560 [Ensifer sp. 1H6]